MSRRELKTAALRDGDEGVKTEKINAHGGIRDVESWPNI